MTTGQNVVDKVRARLLSGLSEQRNKLGALYTAGDPTITLQFPATGIGPQSRLSIGQTVFHVWSITPAGVATIQAGEDGSPDATPTYPVGTLVRVHPRFTDYQVFQEINTDIADLSALGLFQMKPKEFTYNSQFDAFDLAGVTDLGQEYEVFAETPSSRKEWLRLDKTKWRVERLASTTDFPSGLALRIFQPLHNGYKIRLLYKAPFTPLATVSADMTTTGLPTTAYDIPELGAFAALAWVREAKRNMTEAQSEPRRQQAAPSGGMLRSAQAALAQRQRRISSERARLHEQWPTRG